MNTDTKIKELERELAQSKEANAGLMRSCDYLERELGEANEKLRQHASMLKSSDAHNNGIFCELEKERELRAETKSELADMTKQRDALAEALEKAKIAEMQLENADINLEQCRLNFVGRIKKLEQERDALAEALERLEKLPEKWRKECSGNWLRGGVVLQLADDFEAAMKGGDA